MTTVRHQARLTISALMLCAALVPMSATKVAAQMVATSFADLPRVVARGDTVHVIGADGRRTKGRLGDLSASSLELLVSITEPDGRPTVTSRRLSEQDVREIRLQRRDALWNGALIGLAMGAGPWLITQVASGGYGEPGGQNLFLGIALITGAIGTGIGLAVDAAITERPTIYYRASVARQSRPTLEPFFSKGAAGVRMSARF